MRIFFFSVFLFHVILLSAGTDRNDCFMGFKKATQLNSKKESDKIIYQNKKAATFVIVKYVHPKQDTGSILQTLRIQQQEKNASSALLEFDYNGFHVYGTGGEDFPANGDFGNFVLFTAGGDVVYIDFPSITAEQRHFITWEEYKGLRNQFIGEYTNYLKTCLEQ